MKKYVVIAILLCIGILAIVRIHSHGSPSSQPPHNSAATAAGFNKRQYSLTDPASIWVVVNKQRQLAPKSYAPAGLTSVGNGQYMRAAAAQALGAMLAAAKKAGYILTPISGYRSYTTQTQAYDSEVQAYGQTTADSESARPGYSEHQTGWAVDLGNAGCNVQDCFGNTPAGKWAIANAYKFGFLRRYPPNQQRITGYRNESWHFRYVGTALSNELHQTGTQTLEQFFGLPAAPAY